MIFEMVRPDFLMRSLIMPSLKAQLFLVKKLSWMFQRPVTATVAAVAAEAAFLLLRRRLMRLCVHRWQNVFFHAIHLVATRTTTPLLPFSSLVADPSASYTCS